MEGQISNQVRRTAHDGWRTVLSKLPAQVLREVTHIGASRKDFPSGLCEIRLRTTGTCVLVFTTECVRLVSRVSERELSELLERITDGSLYSYRDTLAQGFVPFSGGVRVGVCGEAKYDGGELVGISAVSSVVFRLPLGECGFAKELTELFLTKVRCGMLIYAPPGGGKTTALRSVVRLLSSGAAARRVCVVDERCEFLPEEYLRCEVDILRGYKRSDGIEIAVRTLNPEIVVIDEIGAREAESLGGVVRCGIPIIATAHAANLEELLSKPGIGLLRNMGAFDVFVGIVKEGGEYRFISDVADEKGCGA